MSRRARRRSGRTLEHRHHWIERVTLDGTPTEYCATCDEQRLLASLTEQES